MQTLDIITINLWDILISLVNLLLIFLIVKKFLYRPVKRVLEERQARIDAQYASAAEAERIALDNKNEWDEKIKTAEDEADAIIKDATDNAKYRAAQIVDEANTKAEAIARRAEADAELTRKNAEEGIKREIVEVSSAIAEKMLNREINEEDHREMIDSFIDEMGK